MTGVTSANFGVQRIALTYQERITEFGLRPDITFRLACGFNAENYFVGLHGYHRFNRVGPKIYRSKFESFNIGVTVGIRIEAPKILRRVNGTINGLLAVPKSVF